MNAENKAVLVYTTWPSTETAEAAGRRLIDDGLAACVNILPGMTSLYVWDGAVQRDSETVMVIKTAAALSSVITEAVCAAHPYANPACLVLPVSAGSEAFLDWITECTADPARPPAADPLSGAG